MNNITQLNQFKEINREYFKEKVNGDWVANASIIFQYGDRTVKEKLVVHVYNLGIDAGKVALDEGNKITSKDFHLDFLPMFGIYNCSDKGFLIIENSSQKMGKYKVTIVPV